LSVCPVCDCMACICGEQGRASSNYKILRELAANGDLEAFVALNSLDHLATGAAFDVTVATVGADWVGRAAERKKAASLSGREPKP
jgi:hypothetical protein